MRKRLLTVCAAVCVLLTAAASGSAETLAGVRDGEVILISEPDTQTVDLIAFRQGQPIAADAFSWEDGVHGRALRLNGQSDYLEYTGEAVRSDALSATAWVCWQGSASEEPSGEIGQRLWTLYRDEENYFSVCLHAYRDNIRDTATGAVGRIDGVYMEYKLGGVMGRLREAYNFIPATRDVDYAFPQERWTHVAFTLNGATMRLYIDGRLWFEQDLDNAAALEAATLRIGGAPGEELTLNALIDDAALFPQVLDAESIRALAQGASLDFTGATETTVYRPTRPSGSEDDADEDESALHIPTFAWFVVGAAAAAFVIAVVVVNRRAKEEDDA